MALPGSHHSNSASDSDSGDDDKEYDIRQVRCEAHRRKIGLKLDKKLKEVSVDGDSTKQRELVAYIRRTVVMRECVKYVPKKGQPKSNRLVASAICHCGGTLEEHYPGGSAHTRRRSPGQSSRASDMHNGSMLSGYTGQASGPGSATGSIILTSRVTKDLLQRRQSRQSRDSANPVSASFKKKRNTVYPDIARDHPASKDGMTSQLPSPLKGGGYIFPPLGNDKAGRLTALPDSDQAIKKMSQETNGELVSTRGQMGSTMGSTASERSKLDLQTAAQIKKLSSTAFPSIPSNLVELAEQPLKMAMGNGSSNLLKEKPMFSRQVSSTRLPSGTLEGTGPSATDEAARRRMSNVRSLGSHSISPERAEHWDESTAFRDSPTNAFGKVEFANDESRSKPAKYIRLHYQTQMTDVVQILTKMRMMDPHRPSLAISVIGGAKHFSLDGKKKETFSRGLVKAAQSTNAWILTGGSNMGIMKTVGEAVRNGQTMHLSGHQRLTHTLRCIGIGSWGFVQNRDDLVSPDGQGLWPATYHVDPVFRIGRPMSLDPNHTHFLLVDDGYRNQFCPNVAEFRARLERHIAAPVVRDPSGGADLGGLGIPVVVVLVEGGLGSIDFVYESLRRRVPVVLCQGTGRAADILAYAFTHHVDELSEDGSSSRRTFPEAQKKVVLEKLRAAYGKTITGSSRYCMDILEERLALIMKCCREEELMTVFDMNRHEDLDLAILAGLLKGRGASRLDNLRLSLKWNRPDVAEEKIFTDSATWEWGELEDVMTEALATGSTDFVRLLLQHGVLMRDFLTVRRLRFLYNQAGYNSFLRRLLVPKKGGQSRIILLHHVKSVLERLLERSVEDAYSLDVADDHKVTTPSSVAFWSRRRAASPASSSSTTSRVFWSDY